jgi:hypothetical protein
MGTKERPPSNPAWLSSCLEPKRIPGPEERPLILLCGRLVPDYRALACEAKAEAKAAIKITRRAPVLAAT